MCQRYAMAISVPACLSQDPCIHNGTQDKSGKDGEKQRARNAYRVMNYIRRSSKQYCRRTYGDNNHNTGAAVLQCLSERRERLQTARFPQLCKTNEKKLTNPRLHCVHFRESNVLDKMHSTNTVHGGRVGIHSLYCAVSLS